MKEIMCFGDSNTYGVNPNNNGRWDYNVRWPMKMQKLLGYENYHIIEEGYNGRTTCFPDPFEPLRDGKLGMKIALTTHHPLDMIIIMLGTNDSKSHFATTTPGIVSGIKRLIDIITMLEMVTNNKMPKLFLVSPPHLSEDLSKCPFANFDSFSQAKLLEMASYIKPLANENNALFFDAAKVTHTGPDQLHMDKQSHENLAQVLTKKITEYYK